MKPKHVPLLVAIVGGSGAGKTWLAEKLRARLGRRAARLSLDDFYRDRSAVPPARRARINFDHPRAIDWPLMETALLDLRAGRAACLPVYDFNSHCRLNRDAVLRPAPVVLMDGLWLLRRPAVRRLFDLGIFISCPKPIRLRRRLARDLRSRGRTGAAVRRQFRTTVEPMHARFVAPQARWADVVLEGSFGEYEVRELAAGLETLLANRTRNSRIAAGRHISIFRQRGG